MHIQRPPRGQAWPGAGVGPESGAFSSICSQFECSDSLSTFDRYLAVPCGHCIWWQHNTVQLLFDSLCFPEDSRTEDSKYTSNFGLSVWAFCGDEPHKNCSQIFWIFRKKIPSPKKWKIIFSILGQKTMQIDVIWSQGYGKIVFWPKSNFKIFRFLDLEKNSKSFLKNC